MAPAALEEELKVSPYISNIILTGANKPYNVAIVCPASDALKRWSEETGTSLANLAQNDAVRKLLLAEIQKYSDGFKSYEKPKKIVIIEEDFSQANGLLTPKMSVKRKEVLKRYGHLVDALYSSS